MLPGKYKHDCLNCQRLGTFQIEREIFDVYKCSHGPGMQETVVARFSDQPADYYSTTISCLKTNLWDSFECFDTTLKPPKLTTGRLQPYQLAMLMGVSLLWIRSQDEVV